MLRTSTLIGAAFAVAFSAGAASALPLAPRIGPAPEAAPLAEPVHYRKVRKFRGHYPHVYHRRHSRPSFSFSLNFGTPRYYPYSYAPYYQWYPYPHYTYTYPRVDPYYYSAPRYYRRTGRYFDRW